jgi:Na+/melibiose symporter-like transporter
MANDVQQPAAAPISVAQGQWQVGTLIYTRGGLIRIFSWLLWGDLCLVISEAILLRMVPLQLNALGASSAAVGVIGGSIYSLMNWIMNPLISTGSDRYRSRLGRRMPFLLYTAPLIALFLMGLGCSDAIGNWMNAHFPLLAAHIAHLAGRLFPGVGELSRQAGLTIAMIALFIVLFRFFDLFPQCVYYYLFPDVIPQQVMGTFICLFSVTSAVGNLFFHSVLLPLAATHPRMIYAGSALLYLCTFMLLPMAVKEGTYPPPPPRKKAQPVTMAIGWAREVFSQGFYWQYFLTFSAYRWAYMPFNMFVTIYAAKKLGLDKAGIGEVLSITLIAQLPVLFLLGPLLDRFHATRVAIVGFAAMVLSAGGGFFFIHNRWTFIVWVTGAFVTSAVVKGAMSTVGPRLLPRARYGQFSAANSMVSESGMLFLTYLCGLLLDRKGQQYLFAWMVWFSVFGLLMTVLLYRSWLARGGDSAYTPPPVSAAL